MNQERVYKSYEEMHKASLENKEQFWEQEAKELQWSRFPEQILSQNSRGYYWWFKDGETNITINCLDWHVETQPDKVAFYYEGQIAKERSQITYKELLEQVEKFSYVLSSFGLQQKDRVIIYMPMIIETAVAMLSCARLGLVHSVVFGGFSAAELKSRILDSNAKIIVSASCGLEPHKIVDYPLIIQEAIWDIDQEIKVIYVQRKQKKIDQLKPNEFFYQDLMQNSYWQKAVAVKSNHPLYILYTSGTTGKPKGIYWSHGDTAVGLNTSLKYGFGYNKDSVMFSSSDFGWVVGHSYIVYGPLIRGGSNVIYEGKPVGTPDCTVYFEIIQRLKVSIFYTSPTAIRSIRKEDPELQRLSQFDLSTLKVVGVVGERTDVFTYEYLKWLVPENCLYNDTYWQTETGSFIAANFISPEKFETKGGSCTKAFPGYDIKVLDSNGNEMQEKEQLGHVVIKLPMPPGFMQSLWNNNEWFEQCYLQAFNGYYQTGDAGYFDKNNYLYIMTWTDDIIQVAGHWLSTAQMEECLMSHESISEAIVVGLNDDLKGQLPYGVVVIKDNQTIQTEVLFKQLVQIVRQKIGPIACLNHFSIVPKLPKTRSGKILRATVRKILQGQDYVFPQTLDDPVTLDYIHQIFNTEEYFWSQKERIFGLKKDALDEQ